MQRCTRSSGRIKPINIEDASNENLLGWKTARRYEIPFYNASRATRTDENFFVARIRCRYNRSTVRTVRSHVLWFKSYQWSLVTQIFDILIHLVPIIEQTVCISILLFFFSNFLSIDLRLLCLKII